LRIVCYGNFSKGILTTLRREEKMKEQENAWDLLCRKLGGTVMETTKLAKPEVLVVLSDFLKDLLPKPRLSKVDLAVLVKRGQSTIKELEEEPESLLELLKYIKSLLPPKPRLSHVDPAVLIKRGQSVIKELEEGPGRWAFFHLYSGEVSQGKFLWEVVEALRNRYGKRMPKKIKAFVQKAGEVIRSFERYLK